jgi:GNAT superfamily N-acetyltransferase
MANAAGAVNVQSAAVGAQVIATRIEESGSGDICRFILHALPHWFGIPSSVADYVAVADRSPSVIAMADRKDIGIATLVSHSPYAAEVYVMGVLPEYHRMGAGTAMLRAAETRLASAGVEFLQVKTLSPAKPDAGYEQTRAFYFAYGFRPLEEFPLLWDADNPALQMVKAIANPQ